MEHQYLIQGMHCAQCREKVENRLNMIPGIEAKVSMESAVATIRMEKHISTEILQKALEELGPYRIKPMPHGQASGVDNPTEKKIAHPAKDHTGHLSPIQSPAQPSGKDIYYCPMHCEGDKTYDKPGFCPVCGMHLLPQPRLTTNTVYTCPMHPEIIQSGPGSCPICGMNLVPLHPSEDAYHKTYLDLRKKFIIALAFTIPVFILSMSSMLENNPFDKILTAKNSNRLQFLFSVPVVFYACVDFFERAWVSFKTGKLNMFSLIGIGAGAAFLFSVVGLIFPQVFPPDFRMEDGSVHLYFEACVVILTLVMLGQLLEAKAHAQTGSAIQELLKLAPTEATLVKNGEEQIISINDIQPGDILRVKPGEKIPVDGFITEGSSHIDESMLTGESIPVEKNLNDQLSAGTLNGNRSFLMKAEHVGEETQLSQIIKMVHEASRSRAPIQNLADRVSGYFVPVVFVIAILCFAVWSIWGGEQGMMYGWVNALAVLIVACPCALGLATPMSVMVGVGKGAKQGILIKNAAALEQMNKVNVLIIDKTGTITEGKPSVREMYTTADLKDEKMLMYAAALNQYSEHPLATAVVTKAKESQLFIPSITGFEAVSGKGVRGIVEGKKMSLGNDKMMQDEGVEISETVKSKVIEAQKQAQTISFLSIDGKLQGFIMIADSIRSSSKAAIHQLLKTGVDVVMLTGDNQHTASAVAKEIGLDHFKAQQLPQDKLKTIQQYQSGGKIVAMAGDGINDAPALAQADIGIAMGTGTDVAIETAGITLIKSDLKGIMQAHRLSAAVMRNIKQNLFFAFIYNVIGIPIAAGLLYPTFGILMSPMIAAAAMSLSSVSVILNALRLRRLKL